MPQIAPGYRLPAGLNLGPVTLQVADLRRSIAYYEQILGLRAEELTTDSASLVTGDGTTLVDLRERRGARPAPKRGRLGLFHFAILLPDRAALGRFVIHLRDLGVTPGMSDHLVSEALYLYDRDGLGIEVYADRPRETWRTEGDQIAMAVDPLDLDSLAEAAGGIAWRVMPGGTVMGHVHLHVGDLKEASSFYHHAMGFDLTAWSVPGALLMSAGGYHHHLGTNIWAAGAPPPEPDDAQLLEWNMELPSPGDVEAVAKSLTDAGHRVAKDGRAIVATDPWTTRVRISSSQ
jgi:catechol 2,3-dioxygenase